MAETAGRLSLAAAGRSETLAGTVRLTASELVAVCHLPAILTGLRREEPEITIELIASDRTDNLLRREADIAVRMYRPEQSDVITRKVGEIRIGAYASRDYLDREGRPQSAEDLRNHTVIGDDRGADIIRGMNAYGLDFTRDDFALRTDSYLAVLQAVRAGFGVGFTQCILGDADPLLEQVLPDIPAPPLPIWLTAHAELKTSRRIRRVFDYLCDALAALPF